MPSNSSAEVFRMKMDAGTNKKITGLEETKSVRSMASRDGTCFFLSFSERKEL